MNTASSRRAAAAAAAATSVLALSACGPLSGNDFLDQSPRSMAEDAFTDMSQVESLRVLGSQEGEAGFTRLDIRVDDTNCTGNLDSDQGEVRILKNSDGAWFRGDENFWLAQTLTPQQAKTYAEGWVAIPRKNDFLQLCDLEALLDGFMLDEDDTEASIEAGEVVKIGDADAVPITGTEDKERITAWVAVESPHRVLKLAPADDSGRPDEIYFEEFGSPVVAETPANKDVVKIPKT